MTILTKAEAAWLEQRHNQAEREARETRAPRSLRGRIDRACGKWAEDAAWVAIGLVNATATLPPPSRPGPRTRGAQGPSDPTAAVIGQTYDTVQREAEAFAHLTGRCVRDGVREHDRCCGTVVHAGCKGRMHECPDRPAADLPSVWADPTPVVDALLGTPASSPKAFSGAAGLAASWHAQAAAQSLSAWRGGWQEGREPSELDDWCVQVEDLGRRMASLAGRLADWSGRRERTCRCGGADVGRGARCPGCRSQARQAG